MRQIARPTLNINKDRYALVGGVVQITNDDGSLSPYDTFTADKNGISIEGLKHSPFVKGDRPCLYEPYLAMGVHELPMCAELSDGVQLYLHYKYLIYLNIGSLETPYGIRRLSQSPALVTDDDLKELPLTDNVRAQVILRGISPVRLL